MLLKGSRHISATNASISPEVPKTEKLMKARRRRRGAFIVSRRLESLMKYEARVVDITSQKNVLNRAHWIELTIMPPVPGGKAGGHSKKFEVQTLTLLYTIFDRKRTPFRIPSTENCTPFGFY